MQTGRNWLSGLSCVSVFILSLISSLIIAGCSETTPYTGELSRNQMPVVELTSGPVEGDSVKYKVHFYWLGDDPDGEIDHYEIALVDGDPIGFDPDDTTGADKWTAIRSTDTLIVTSADEFSGTVTINNALYAIYDRMHIFFIRAIDDRGGVSATAYRSFNAWTLAPHVFITEPENVNPDGGIQTLSPVINFGWYGKDPVESPWNYQDVDSVRYLWFPFYLSVIRDLNEFPEKFDALWGDWLSIDAPGDSGRSTILGDDEIIPTGRSYIFAVQAKDEAGAISSVFDRRTNVRAFRVNTPRGPLMTVNEARLGEWSFIGYDTNPVVLDIAPGLEMNFTWTGDASDYGAIVSTYRYGWDITDFNDPSQWETLPTPGLRNAAPKTFYSGIHTLYIESADNLGIKTLCAIETGVVPVLLERTLMWVDDLPSNDFTQTLYAFPTESAHDAFWTDICMKVPAFIPSRDIYDVYHSGCRLPPLSLVFKYKNIIWTYSNSYDLEDGSRWNPMLFWGTGEFFNPLPYYMAFGGHVWTNGVPSGLSVAHASCPRPCVIEDHNYSKSLPSDQFCVSVLDKGHRDEDQDGLAYASLDLLDLFTFIHPGLPKRLELWDMVTRPGMFFDPSIRGFYYLEAYNPEYYMEFRDISAQECFHPMYRVGSLSPGWVLDDATVAFWTTRYADVVPPGETGVPAASVHFGIPLWFFDRAQVDSIATVIFEEWQILD